MKLLIRLVTALCLMPFAILHAQTITITPQNSSVWIKAHQQFLAEVHGLKNTAINLYVQGTLGGNATYGTISTTGYYLPPATIPAQNPILITATSVAQPTLTVSTYITLLGNGPNLLKVTPNPLNTGTINLTLTGKGFMPGAEVVDTSNGSAVQMETTYVNSTTLTASGYQPPAPNAQIKVYNPGTAASNTITVPVTGGGGNNYTLTVNSGSGGGTYSAGTTVAITANAPPSGSVFKNWTGATVANPNAASTTLVMPAAATTVTANYTNQQTFALTVVNGSGSGNYVAGQTVTITANAPTAGETFSNWTGATVANPNAATTTLSMPAAATTVTANYGGIPIPFPVTTHPRLWVTSSDVSRLQSWATSSNPVYAQGMQPLLQQAVTAYTTQFFPNGQPNTNYPDPGDVQGYTGLLTEQYGAVLAFNSLIDPNPNNRILYAQYARNLLMYAMNIAAQGPLANAPFRDPAFPIYNRANGSGEQWPLMVDWLYSAKDGLGNPILTASDKLTIQKVFLWWANACINASTTGGDHPEPIGATNNLSLLPNNLPYRMACNNYYLGHARLLTMMGLSMDPADDPAVNATLPLSALGNSVRSYILNANGAWLYQTYAMMGEASAVASSYGISGNGAGFGLASGGLPPEGMLYGHSFGFVLGQLLALQTAGFNNVAYTGPQINLINSPVWDRYVKGYMSSLTPTAMVFASESWLGAVYQFACYGDVLRMYVTEDGMEPFTLLSLLEGENGLTTHANAARWFAVNALPGGAASFMTNITDPWSWSSTQSILYYMLLDPSAPAGTDPRPTFPTTFVDPPAGRIVAHSDWSSTNTMFDYRASWESINHQHGDAGQFELLRNGEWLTKEMSNYDNNGVGYTPLYHNSLCIQNWCQNGTPPLGEIENGEWKLGGQWILGENGGDPTTLTSYGTNYAYASTDMTQLYNYPNFWTPANGAVDVTQATRQILWINKDNIVVYDRATTNHSGLFKTFNLAFINQPTTTGNTTVETMASGQSLTIQTLLPSNPTMSVMNGAANLSPVAELEPTKYIWTVQDPTKPADTRFLHVMQAANSGVTPVTATYLSSTTGTAFDGASFGSTVVYFPTHTTPAVATTTFTVPTGTHTFIVTGLKPGAACGVTINGSVVTLNPAGSGYTADSAGLLMVSM